MPIIEYKKANLLDCKEKLIAHGCNAKGVMGSGVAGAIRKKYPGAYEVYRERFKTHGLLLGSCVRFRSLVDNKIIYNLITQENFGNVAEIRYVSYDAIERCFSSLDFTIRNVKNMEGHGLAIPKIGAGLGGGNWNIIETIINETTPSVDIVVYEL